jgi:hypothetical protein
MSTQEPEKIILEQEREPDQKEDKPYVVETSMLKASHLVKDGCIILNIKREALDDNDVKECIDIFQSFLNTRLKPNEMVRILVNASGVHVPFYKIKIKIVHAFEKHFRQNLNSYLPHLKKCAIVVDSKPIVVFFSPIIKALVPDGNKIKLTTNMTKAMSFLKN